MGVFRWFRQLGKPLPRYDMDGDPSNYPVRLEVPCPKLDEISNIRGEKSLIADWCEEHLEERYTVRITYPVFIGNEDFSGTYEIMFANDRDAFNFKMRWL
ncbi:MAG: hypothetical protein EOP83_19975 [Verrucomicrobiaceae bacterium]|nr:MAG: hypothetical protein EOP83_19975 [Verrucomicrobiaceae bacterium]